MEKICGVAGAADGDDEGEIKKLYHKSQKILLVGEGDFSFAASLATTFGSALNLVATSLDSREGVVEKYSGAAKNLNKLDRLGCTIIYGVDAHKMSNHRRLRQKLFDKVVYNFPHAGLTWPCQESQIHQIKLHQYVVQGFLRNASSMIANGGEVHVTHKTSHPYSRWEIEKLAENVRLSLIEAVRFTRSAYPGYINKRGYGKKRDKTFRVGDCITFVFGHT